MLYRHYKGGLYRLLHEDALIEAEGENSDAQVVYQNLETDQVWIRPVHDFFELVDLPGGLTVRRFEEVEWTVTDAQYGVIEYIRRNLGIRFSGTTKEDATQFISDHIEASKAARQRAKETEPDTTPDHTEYGLMHMDIYGEQY